MCRQAAWAAIQRRARRDSPTLERRSCRTPGELCPYYADPERPGQIYVYQSCWDEGTGTTYMAYVRYEAETTN